jgi:hypothetical protein
MKRSTLLAETLKIEFRVVDFRYLSEYKSRCKKLLLLCYIKK